MKQHTCLIIRRVDENFIHDLEKARNILDFTMYHALALGIVCPHQLGDSLHTPDVRIRSFENVLELSQLGPEQGQQASRKDLIVRTFVYVSDAVFFFP
jgi:hypothetical protein